MWICLYIRLVFNFAIFSISHSFPLFLLMLHNFYSKQEGQIILLLNEMAATSESSGNACMMLIQVGDLPFVSISRLSNLASWKLDEITVRSHRSSKMWYSFLH